MENHKDLQPCKIFYKLATLKTVWLMLVFLFAAEILTAIITPTMSFLFHRKVYYDYLITGFVAAFIVSLVVLSILLSLINMLSLERKKFINILNAMEDGVYIISRDYNIEYINPIIEKEFGKKDGKKCYNYLHDRAEPCPWCNTQKVFSGEQIHTQVFCSKNNKTYELFDTSVITHNGDLSKLGIIHDITKRKQMDEEIKTINQKLQNRVVEEVAKNRTKDQLMFEQSRHISMGELLMNISHHWRQPLCSIGLSIQDIKEAYMYGELDGKYLDNNIKSAMSDLNDLSETLDKFRNLYTYEKEQTEFNASEAIDKAEVLISGYIKNMGIRIEKELDRSLIIKGFQNEFTQIILNILTNAKDKFEQKSIPDGIIRVKLNKDAATDRMIISVLDNGGEIPNDIINKVFEPYFTTKDKAQRTGMGLYMSKVIVEQNMKGTLSARNNDGWCDFRIEI
ncbi:MAG: PAS domain-containing sensor histidine kinase [Nitrospirae bacterium]|nr:PAS domain-containing sensor histidine kinase [Nitrospirota bacterium]MBF0535482.1 PAS domain-containing sensor histidine kinase [Nitrospirota bacterium]MBF0617386.1 PAS domain-containing sensor histidine kinase [Nitrospirota bacterium]